MLELSGDGWHDRGYHRLVHGGDTLPDTFAEANKNITCFVVADILRMLEDSGCGHVPKLQSLVVSSDASVLRDILEDVQKVAGRLVRRWWTNHGLPKCMHRLKEDNQVN
jgi:hypothetical protein